VATQITNRRPDLDEKIQGTVHAATKPLIPSAQTAARVELEVNGEVIECITIPCYLNRHKETGVTIKTTITMLRYMANKYYVMYAKHGTMAAARRLAPDTYAMVHASYVGKAKNLAPRKQRRP